MVVGLHGSVRLFYGPEHAETATATSTADVGPEFNPSEARFLPPLELIAAMSYAANAAKIKSSTARQSASSPAKGSTGKAQNPAASPRKPKGRPYEEPTDWGRMLLLGATVAAGAALGAGVALLMTDKTGPERLSDIVRGARRVGHRAEHAWDDLAFELREAARSARGRLHRRRHIAPAADDDDDED